MNLNKLRRCTIGPIKSGAEHRMTAAEPCHRTLRSKKAEKRVDAGAVRKRVSSPRELEENALDTGPPPWHDHGLVHGVRSGFGGFVRPGTGYRALLSGVS